MKLARFNPFSRRDPLLVTPLPCSQLTTEQERLDAETVMTFNRNVARNVREKAPERAKKIADLRLKWAEKQSLTYLRQAS